jgi:hypothetical protein
MNVKEERTGWRCEEISARHRAWGYNCPAVDLDFLVAEYNYGKPVALVEYKHERAAPPSLDHPTYQTLVCLADKYSDGPLPAFIARYCPRLWWFQVTALNKAARDYYGEFEGQTLSEQQFVRSLYLLRKKELNRQDLEAIASLRSTAEPHRE